jgi:hypothetical protein
MGEICFVLGIGFVANKFIFLGVPLMYGCELPMAISFADL